MIGPYTQKLINVTYKVMGLCIFCKKTSVIFINSNEPYNDKHWRCPKCNNTFAYNEYYDYKKEGKNG